MKRKILNIMLVLATINVVGQNWAAPGATWHYTSNGLTSEGYVVINKISDTLINGNTCDVLKKQRFSYDFINLQYDTTNLGREYTYSNGNKVFFWRNGQFYTLYDFNAIAGNAWLLPGVLSCSDDSVIVDSVRTVIINTISLKKLYIHSLNNQVSIGDSIVEKIGSYGYMFPEPMCIIDATEGGSLRCYSDSSNFSYDIGLTSSCDFIMAVKDLDTDDEIKIYPNPTISYMEIQLSGKGISELCITNILGEVLFRKDFPKAQSAQIDVSGLSPGVYILSISDSRGIYSKKVIVERK
jgi:hypothetical protein